MRWMSRVAVFEDISDRRVLLHRSRITPFGSPFNSRMLRPNETLSAAHGGAFPGIVTWVDHLYVARDVLESHLWGWAQASVL
jgi:hypothetical protein